MLDLRLRYEGAGRFQTATKLDFDLAAETYSQGDVVRAETTQPRSLRQNNYLHAIIQSAHETQSGGPRFGHWKQMRAWLLIEAGYCNEERFKVPGTSRNVATAFGKGLAQALRRGERYEAVAYDPKTAEFVIRTPISLKFHGKDALTADEAGELTDRIVAIVCTEIVPGMDPQSIMDNAKARVLPARKEAA
jgi:hypothetical protein